MNTHHLEALKDKYTGNVAKSYEKDRRNSEHWRQEQKIIEHLIDKYSLPRGSEVLDIPVGTGRFLKFYRNKGYRVHGLDASPDMLSEARGKAEALGYADVDLTIGDITNISLEDERVDLAVCIRLMNWFDFSTFRQALSELARVSSQYLIVGVRMTSGWTQVELNAWLRQLSDVYKRDMRSFARGARRSLRQKLLFYAHPPQPEAHEPLLVDHSETAVRRAFQEQGLTVVQEELAISFTGEPSLSRPGAIENLPYVIFVLRV